MMKDATFLLRQFATKKRSAYYAAKIPPWEGSLWEMFSSLLDSLSRDKHPTLHTFPTPIYRQ